MLAMPNRPNIVIRALGFGFAALACASAAAQQTALVLRAPDAVKPILNRYLSVLTQSPAPDLADEVERIAVTRRARREVADLLATEGYFSPTVRIEEGGSGFVLVVEPGRRAEIAAVDIAFAGAIAEPGEDNQQRIERLRRRWKLKQGEPFTQSAWDESKQGLVDMLSRRDFAAARISASKAEVDPLSAKVDLAVTADAGPRFTLGELQVSGLHDYSPDLVARYNPPKPGERYDEDRLLAFQGRLQNTPYFSSVIVDVSRESSDGQQVPVRVQLAEAKPRRITLGAGYSSNTGYRAEMGYRDANLFDRAWYLVSGLRLEQKQSLLFGDVFLPPAGGGYQYSFGGLAERSDLEGLRLSREAVGATRSHQRGKIETSVALKFQRERTHPDGADESRQDALTLDWSWVMRDVNDVFDPRRGFVVTARVGGAAKSLLSDQNFVRTYLRYQHYFPIARRDVLSLRGEWGTTFAESSDGIPQDFLFRAGGSQSVRGYAFQSLGVTDGSATVGGRYLATLSAEYTHWLDRQWGVAAFLDAGNAADERPNFRLLPGYGMGARWRSPAGPLALDLAYGHAERQFRLHFSIAIAF